MNNVTNAKILARTFASLNIFTILVFRKNGQSKKYFYVLTILYAECLLSHLRAIAPNETWSRFIGIHNKAINWRIAIMALYFCRIKPYAYHFISNYSN